jgi:hypothetical protein
VTRGGRNLQNEELHNLYSSPGTIRMVKSRRVGWEFFVSRMVKRNAYTLFVGNPESKRPLGRPTRRWGDNIKMGLEEI